MVTRLTRLASMLLASTSSLAGMLWCDGSSGLRARDTRGWAAIVTDTGMPQLVVCHPIAKDWI
jgi:hypothetical protein